MHLHLDPLGGIAGDMFVAAMVNAFPHLSDPLLACVAALRLEGVRARMEPHRDEAASGLRFIVEKAGEGAPEDPRGDHGVHGPGPAGQGVEGQRSEGRGAGLPGARDHAHHDHAHHDHGDHRHAHGHSHGHDHGPGHDHTHGHAHTHSHLHGHTHTHGHAHGHEHPHGHDHMHDHDHDHAHLTFADIKALLHRVPLGEGVREHAIGIFAALAEAEGIVHGAPPEEVTFHEVGAWDSIVDIVGAAFLIDAVGEATWSVAPLPLGSGRVRCAHGIVPVPAPATLLLLRGFTVFDDGLPGERVTPTGAAILHYLGCRERLDATPRVVAASGSGFGARRLKGMSNVLRVLAFEAADEAARAEKVALLAFEIDDQTGEELAQSLDRLRAHPQVLDVTQFAGFGKKGRMVCHIQVLARPEGWRDVADLCFSQTTTLGLRWQLVPRLTLGRKEETARLDEIGIRVKLAERPGGRISAKADIDDVADAPLDFSDRRALRRRAEARVLGEGET